MEKGHQNYKTNDTTKILAMQKDVGLKEPAAS